ncbi:MAG: FAD-dependent oxidoreductase [Candidatus Hydrogenedentes bacterium]|nr:FAD-dependent oxidoreductase [Candidatus Hydrogenedentota bacterium]
MVVGVIGGGPAGVTAAYELAKHGVSVDLYEAGDTLGGLARSMRLWNQTVDLGPHRFFSKLRRVNELWLEVVGRDYAMVNRNTRIYYNGKFFHYPLRPMNALSQLGPIEALHCVGSYFKEQVAPSRRGSLDTFEDWVVDRFGRRLFEIFFRTYSEKLWGISCNKLDSDFAAQRIKKLNLLEALKNTVQRPKSNPRHQTLVDQFAYPLQGTGMVYRRMGELVEHHGGRVLLRTPVQRVLTKDGRAFAIELDNGETKFYDSIISSMPISLLVSRLPEVPDEVRESALSLRFRNTILVYLNIPSESLFPDQWLYVHSENVRMGRITNFRNWVPQLNAGEESTILAIEYWANDEDALWANDDTLLIQLAQEELRKTGLIADEPILGGHVVKIRRCYPVYRAGYKEVLRPVMDYLKDIDGLQAIGRYGAFKYNNQDHSILMGLMAAENIAHGANHDLWGVNTDYEDYQESAVITESGLSVSGAG